MVFFVRAVERRYVIPPISFRYTKHLTRYLSISRMRQVSLIQIDLPNQLSNRRYEVRHDRQREIALASRA